MKADELMVNDWVLADYKVGKQVFAKVGLIDPRHADREHDKIGFLPVPMIDDLEQYINDERSIHPIPLTPEILKANGFEDETADFWKLQVDDKPHHYSFRLNKGGVLGSGGYNMNCNIYTITISYVHQLQHAFRMCGLNELADNFKVE